VPVQLRNTTEWIEAPPSTSLTELLRPMLNLREQFQKLSEGQGLQVSQQYSDWLLQYTTSLRFLMQLQQLFILKMKQDLPIAMKRILCYTPEENKQILATLGMVPTDPRPFRTRRTKRSQSSGENSSQSASPPLPQAPKTNIKIAATFQHKCCFCGRTDTPEWRRGPDGRRTLCNACGLIYKKRNKMLSEKNLPNLASAQFLEEIDSASFPCLPQQTRSQITLLTGDGGVLKGTSGEEFGQLLRKLPILPLNGHAGSWQFHNAVPPGTGSLPELENSNSLLLWAKKHAEAAAPPTAAPPSKRIKLSDLQEPALQPVTSRVSRLPAWLQDAPTSSERHAALHMATRPYAPLRPSFADVNSQSSTEADGRRLPSLLLDTDCSTRSGGPASPLAVVMALSRGADLGHSSHAVDTQPTPPWSCESSRAILAHRPARELSHPSMGSRVLHGRYRNMASPYSSDGSRDSPPPSRPAHELSHPWLSRPHTYPPAADKVRLGPASPHSPRAADGWQQRLPPTAARDLPSSSARQPAGNMQFASMPARHLQGVNTTQLCPPATASGSGSSGPARGLPHDFHPSPHRAAPNVTQLCPLSLSTYSHPNLHAGGAQYSPVKRVAEPASPLRPPSASLSQPTLRKRAIDPDLLVTAASLAGLMDHVPARNTPAQASHAKVAQGGQAAAPQGEEPRRNANPMALDNLINSQKDHDQRGDITQMFSQPRARCAAA